MIPVDPCNGCIACAMRCTAGIRIAEFECDRILEALRACDPHHARRVLTEPKEREWFEGIHYTACLFLDMRTQQCLIAAARPLVCRLFGRVAHLPCPAERIPADLDARHLLAGYTAQPLRTFSEWLAERGLFDFDALLAPAPPREPWEV